MRPTTLLTTLAGLTTLAACATTEDMAPQRLATATLANASGNPVATAEVLAIGDSVSLAIAATGLQPGPHGFHLHTTGTCSAPDFASAGGHLNPLGREHGSLNPAGSHVGDLANLVASASGTASATYDLPGTREQLRRWLFDADGTAIVIHAGPDDYRSDPAGDAGARVACGVLARTS